MIGEVTEGMGASEAGLQSGDIIKKVDDVKINTFSDLTGYLSTKRPGEKVEVSFSRDNTKNKIKLPLKKLIPRIFRDVSHQHQFRTKEYFDLDMG